MNHRLPILLGSAFALALCATADARASFIQWSYNWTASSPFVSATTGTGRIYTSNESLAHAQGSTDIVVTDLRTASTSPGAHPDVFTNAAFSSTLTIMDGRSGKSSSAVTFAGVFNGTLSAGGSAVDFTLTSAKTQTLLLGKELYTITLGHYSPPGPPSAQNSGSISAHVSVKDASPQHAPEPSTALLACLGGSFLGLASWRRWARGKQAAPAAA
jgi:hypothetical protein